MVFLIMSNGWKLTDWKNESLLIDNKEIAFQENNF